MWLDLRKVSTGVYVWDEDNEPLTWTHWEPGQPSSPAQVTFSEWGTRQWKCHDGSLSHVSAKVICETDPVYTIP